MDSMCAAFVLQVELLNRYVAFLDSTLRTSKRAIEELQAPFIPSPEVCFSVARQMVLWQMALQQEAGNRERNAGTTSRT